MKQTCQPDPCPTFARNAQVQVNQDYFDKMEASSGWAWGPWGPWNPCSKTCDVGLTWRTKVCKVGACAKGVGAREVKTCQEKYCDEWTAWGEWTSCSATCGGGIRSRQRFCDGGIAGHKGCQGSKFDTDSCRQQKCEKEEGEKEGKLIPSFRTPFSLRPFEQSCVDYHNFFRALHNQVINKF